MKFLCDKNSLESALLPVLSAVPTKDSPQASLKSFLIQAEGDSLLLRSTNMELSVETRVSAVKIEKEGYGLIPARPFFFLLREISDPTVTIGLEKEVLEIPTSSGHFKIVTGDPNDFPELQFGTEKGAVRVPLDAMSRLFNTTEFACAREATKYAMNGILFSLKDGTLTFVATDGRRLALNSHPLEVDKDKEFEALVPQKCLGAVVKALAGTAEEVEVTYGEGRVCFLAPDCKIAIQNITGEFPDFQAVIPKESKNQVEFNRSLLETNLKRAAILTDEMNPAVKITIEENHARFESESVGMGSADTKMEVNHSGPGGHIIFNPHFLFEALKTAQQDPVRFEFDDSNSPGKFTLDEQFLYILMPITGV